MSTPDTTLAEENWAALRTLSVYRWSVAALLAGLWYTGQSRELLPNFLPEWLPLLSSLYLSICPALSLCLLFRWPNYRSQIYLHVGMDILLTTGLVVVSGGMAGGLGVLMLTPVGGLATLVPKRMAALLAAVASLALLSGEILGSIYSLFPESDYTLAGLIGVLLFIVTLTANTLAQRARINAELAAKRGLDLANLSQLNERVIQHMAVGVVVLDENDDVRMLNNAAARLLSTTIQSGTRKSLAILSSELTEILTHWRKNPEVEINVDPVDIGGHTILPHFTQLGHSQGPALVFLEDAKRFGEQTQQIKLAALGRLTASIAHEIRNPLGAISHASQLIQQWENTPDEEERLLKIIERHCQRINQIVENVLNLSRRQETVQETLHLKKWLSQLGEEYLQTHPDEEINLRIENVPVELQVRFDPSHLRQIIGNLWENASQHKKDSHEEMTITLDAGVDSGSGRPYLEICDQGPGIPEKIAEQIFEPFYTSMHDGTGLGLYIARELCECNNAQIKLVRHEDSGACFRILFASNLEWAA